MLDINAIRSEFPVLQQALRKEVPVTFLDSAASAQKPVAVVEAERDVYERYYANAYRGVYRFGAMVDEQLEATRETVRSLINAESSDEVIFTAGSTMSLNIVASGWGRKFLKPGDEILLNIMEHHANLVPWQQTAHATGAVLKYLPLTPDGRLDLSKLDEFLTPKTRIVAVAGMSNVLGTIHPIRELAHRAHEVGAIIVVDGAQSVPHAPVDVRADGIDFLAFSGHKIYGPSGVGVLYGRRDLLEATDPLLFGGHMIDRVFEDHSTWALLPAKFEAGTLPIAQAIALRHAIEFVNSIGFAALHEYEHGLLLELTEKLSSVTGVQIYGPAAEHKGAIVSFTMDSAHPEDLAHLLDRQGVFVRHGHHCTMLLHNWLNVPATVRASLAVYNNREDVDRLIEALHFARHRLRLD